jgi:hypothetical protein
VKQQPLSVFPHLTFLSVTHLFVRAGCLLNDNVSLAGAGYSEQQYLTLVVVKPPAFVAAPIPVAIATGEQPRVTSQSTESNVSAAAQNAYVSPAAAAAHATPAVVSLTAADIAALSEDSRMVLSKKLYPKLDAAFKQHLAKTGFDNEEAMGMRRTLGYMLTGRIPSLEEPPSSSPPPPAINFASEWLDEYGCVCPKAVDYTTQCPKGHALVRYTDGGCNAPAQSLLCRVCHTFTGLNDASQWLVCSAAGCCAGYAVCDCCVHELRKQAPASAAGSDDTHPLVCA